MMQNRNSAEALRAGRSRVLWSLWIALLVTGCSDLFPPTHPYSTLEVDVTSDQGEPIAGIGLVLYDARREMGYGVTGFDGRHTFRYIPEGDYGVWIGSPEGYRLPEGANPYVHGIRLEDSARDQVSFTLIPRRGSLRVVVADPAGNGVQGVEMLIYNAAGGTWDGVTGADGSHTEMLPVGEYGVRPTPGAGYRLEPVYVDGVVVAEDVTRELEFTLTPVG